MDLSAGAAIREDPGSAADGACCCQCCCCCFDDDCSCLYTLGHISYWYGNSYPFEARALRPKNQWLRYFQASTCSLSSQQYEQDHAAPIPYGSLHYCRSDTNFYHPQPAVAGTVIVNFRRQFFPPKSQRGCVVHGFLYCHVSSLSWVLLHPAMQQECVPWLVLVGLDGRRYT